MENVGLPTPDSDKKPRSPREHYEHLLKELSEFDDPKYVASDYAEMKPELVQQLRQNKIDALARFRKEHPEFGN